MGEALDRVREVLKRLFLGRARVRGDFFPQKRHDMVHALSHRALTLHSLERDVRISGACTYHIRPMRCGSASLVSGGAGISVHGGGMTPFAPSVGTVSLALSPGTVQSAEWATWKPLAVRKGTRTLLDRIPQRRSNVARFLRGRKLPVDGAVLAIFEAVVQKAGLRGVLDKGSGELLLWLHPDGGVPVGGLLVLVRRFREGQGLAWQWIKREQGGGGFPARG